MKLIRLSDDFYRTYGACKEILEKESRPYMCLTIRIDDIEYALPIRHHFKHPYGFHTLGEAGIDYTKAIPIIDKSFIDNSTPRIESAEWRILKRNENRIYNQFRKYLKTYKRAKLNPENERNANILRCSSLQHFDI